MQAAWDRSSRSSSATSALASTSTAGMATAGADLLADLHVGVHRVVGGTRTDDPDHGSEPVEGRLVLVSGGPPANARPRKNKGGVSRPRRATCRSADERISDRLRAA